MRNQGSILHSSTNSEALGTLSVQPSLILKLSSEGKFLKQTFEAFNHEAENEEEQNVNFGVPRKPQNMMPEYGNRLIT